MTSRTILVVEDDAAICRGLKDALEFTGYSVVVATDGLSAIDLASTVELDLLLLDLNLPGCDGIEALQKIRQSKPTVPVIILSARGAEQDRVRGLRLGADDYVVKPFSVHELLARIEAVMRRTPERPLPNKTLVLPDGVVDLEDGTFRLENGETRQFSERDCDLLRYLSCNPGRVVTRNELLSRVWHVRPEGLTTRTVDMQVARLREKLKDNGDSTCVIETIRGKGYRFNGGPETEG